MVTIFRNVRAQRNESLLDILEFVAFAGPSSRKLMAKRLGSSPGKKRAYSNVHKNTAFLEQKGFLTGELQEGGRNEKLYDITVKGALASLFAPSSILDHSKLLKKWREKDWGPGYERPFREIKDVFELKKLIETVYFYGSSLEEVSEAILKRGLRDPEDAQKLLQKAYIKVEKKVALGEIEKYEVRFGYVPGSTFVQKLDEPKNISIALVPNEKDGAILYNLISKNPHYKEQIEISLQLVLQTIVRDLVEKGDEEVFSRHHYFPDSKTFVLVLTLPCKVVSLLRDPEQILKSVRDPYRNMVNALLNWNELDENGSSWVAFTGLKYDPKRRDLSSLPRDELGEKARKILEKLCEE